MLGGMVQGEELLWPLPDHTYLTGGFADSRYDHFHGGVDIRTGGEHLAVLAPLDGRIERLAVTPSGYGKVVYFRMSNDTTAVFGHLDHFSPRLEAIVRDSQLVAGTYRVDLIYEEPFPELEFKQGETLAYTGQTGRGAPHLHYELRTEAVQIDPLASYMRSDKKPPVITELQYLRKADFNLQANGRTLQLTKQGVGRYSANPIQSEEPIAFLVSCYDPGPWNRQAVPSRIRVIVDDEVIYETHPTEIDLLGPKDIYADLVWSDVSQRDRDVRRLFSWPVETESGWISDCNNLPCIIEVIDRSGNKSEVKLTVSAGTGSGLGRETVMHEIRDGRFVLTGDAVSCSFTELSVTGELEAKVGDPLDGFFDRLKLTCVLPPNEDRTGLYWYKRSSKGRSALWTVPNEPDSIMSCYMQRGGTFGLARDTTPPKLLLTRNGRGFKFDLRDPETGIDDSTVRCTIDGITAIAEYEYEENGGAMWTQTPLGAGEHAIFFTAANRAGIVKEWTVSMPSP